MSTIGAILQVLGVVTVGIGVLLISVPAGVIVLGVGAVLVGFLMERG